MATQNTSIDINFSKQVAHALEMAIEIMAENTRQYSLASVLTDHIEGGTTAHGLAEVLEDRLSEIDQKARLVECLENIQKEYCHE